MRRNARTKPKTTGDKTQEDNEIPYNANTSNTRWKKTIQDRTRLGQIRQDTNIYYNIKSTYTIKDSLEDMKRQDENRRDNTD